MPACVMQPRGGEEEDAPKKRPSRTCPFYDDHHIEPRKEERAACLIPHARRPSLIHDPRQCGEGCIWIDDSGSRHRQASFHS